ncbi:Fe-S cluster assembly protein HesB [Actinosynnema sp. ALI-1.44]|uniref:HhH-GPD-type base excision DNA repair protein n=1 Tax=Actinosynnema sp. ALI-1.44 TaxID=1933779 RepID=UPI00097BD555|nr:HhH-GPD-type base excision DNA repair protein [Actinosynnema sp. ALI-1.44]ONI85805.1 Fe-S cluster assembly protein HesB [Actinosynnema sp. ALI-1.44]
MTRKLHLAGEPEADALLARDPLALLIGMLLDQQIPMEVAFKGPQKLVTKMGKLDVHEIAEYDPDAFATLATTPPGIHRYGGAMAKRVQALCQYIVETYDGKADRIWKQGKPDGPEIFRRLKALPGYGEQKAKIFLALLGKQFALKAEGWREAAGAYGEDGSRRSIADVTSAETLAEVRAFKKATKAAAKAK